MAINFLERARFAFIYRMLTSGLPSWEIVDEVFCGSPITKEEIEFVVINSKIKEAISN